MDKTAASKENPENADNGNFGAFNRRKSALPDLVHQNVDDQSQMKLRVTKQEFVDKMTHNNCFWIMYSPEIRERMIRLMNEQ